MKYFPLESKLSSINISIFRRSVTARTVNFGVTRYQKPKGKDKHLISIKKKIAFEVVA